LLRIKRMLGLFLMNHIFVGTRFFQVGTNVSIVGPISVGNVCEIHIGENCWLGKDMKIYGSDSVSLFNNNIINEGVVIGLDSVVNKSCDKNCVYAGDPAKVIKRLDSGGFY